MKSENTKRRLDPLMLLAVMVITGVMMTSPVSAAESFLSKPNFTDLQDGDIILAGTKHGSPGIHMSFLSPSELYANSHSGHVVMGFTGTMPDVYLSLRLPW
jgi:hypothetical protein